MMAKSVEAVKVSNIQSGILNLRDLLSRFIYFCYLLFNLFILGVKHLKHLSRVMSTAGKPNLSPASR